MSLILDALKKSETERQEQGSADFSTVPQSSGSPNPARWLWMLAALLAVNFAVLIFILLRPDSEPAATVAAEEPPVAAADAIPGFEKQIAEAIEERPSAAVATTVAPPQPSRTAAIPTIDQLRLNGSLQLPELRLDIHVFSDNPAERFVFINMVKHRKQSRIAAGPVVKEITPDGVILEYQGRAFLLPRQ